ncbi:MAG TPA: phosphoglycerate mutase family protein [Chloroflexota bacterium]|nr:phosphoglycerate mutase family protein [Chloroflexota bacterium]
MASLDVAPALLYLIRHGKAGDPERWRGDDRERPLTKNGRRQAEALSELFQHDPIKCILSSPYRRCLETVAPLARRLGLSVAISATLAAGADADAVMALLLAAPAGTALCSHGDVIPAILDALAANGLLRAADIRCEKGATWVLERAAGRLTSARYVAAPAVGPTDGRTPTTRS